MKSAVKGKMPPFMVAKGKANGKPALGAKARMAGPASGTKAPAKGKGKMPVGLFGKKK